MDLKKFIRTSERGTATKLAGALGVSVSYLSQMAAGHCPISEKRCVLIECVTKGVVSRRDLRPDDWHLIWPELVADLEIAR
ncbi:MULTISPECIES: transcriptional regulator [Burkholderia]|uniref:transcriptional regulator n=1 Tax=Burkholderia TaxID=32008 RepID=UPI00075C36FA|nr:MULTISPECIES: YdaS family helix-turn-helix protein [Burkholderia]